jgi:hypothetical protein
MSLLPFRGAGDKKVAERRHSARNRHDAIGAVRPVVEEHGFPRFEDDFLGTI